MNEQEIRETLVALATSLFNRGYAVGGAGNISAKLPDGCILMTPTNSSLGRLNPSSLSKVSPSGERVSGDCPSKEIYFHRAAYDGDSGCGAVVHLHSTYLTALSCLDGLNRDDVLQPFTPYYVMRVGRLPLIPYFRPGHPGIAGALKERLGSARAFLLANHGSIVLGKDIVDAVNNAEELEETAKVFFLLGEKKIRYLSGNEVAELRS